MVIMKMLQTIQTLLNHLGAIVPGEKKPKEDQAKKIRRRIEDYLRKTTPEELMRIAILLSINIV